MADSRFNIDILQRLVQEFQKNVRLTNFEESPGSERGDNYTSMLYRIKLEGYCLKERGEELWERAIIYKCLPDNTIRREAFKSDQLFQNEVVFYTDVLPLFMKFQKEKKVTRPFKAIPKCYLARNDSIVLEDLCSRGFSMADRKQGLNYEQCSSVIPELAKFHAVSLAMKVSWPLKFKELVKQNGGISEQIFTKRNEEWYRAYYRTATANALSMVQDALSKQKLKEKYMEKFRDFVDENFFSRMVELASGDGPLAVLCHGDCWTNNILFRRYESGDIAEVCFVDFQLCRYGSAALDLANLIYCCTTRELRENKLLSLLSLYYRTLHASLLEMSLEKQNPFANEDYLWHLIRKEFHRCGLFGLGLALDMIPISTCDSDQAPDLYDNENDNDTDAENLPVSTSSELCKRKMANLVCELVDNGVL